MSRDKKTLVVLLFAASVAFSVWFCLLKQDALGYHTRDFAFFAQTQAKLLDPGLTNRLSLNPDGHSYLGLRGTEGEKSIHQAIHFAPIKYVHALLYVLTGSLLLVYVFNSIVVFGPALYVGWLGAGKKGNEGWFYFLMATAYLAYPSIHHVAAHDLRHYLFIGPLFALAVIAIHFQRPVLERLLFFNLLFFAREEALVLGSVVIFYGIAMQKEQGIGAIIRTEMRWYLLSYAFWFAAIVMYYLWTGYSQEHPLVERAALTVLFLLAGIGGILVARFCIDRFSVPGGASLVGLAALLTSFGPFLYHGGIWRQVDIFSLLFFDRYFLYVVCAYVSVLAFWRVAGGELTRRVVVIGLGLFVVMEVCVNSSLLDLPGFLSNRETTVVAATRDYLEERDTTRIVHRAAGNLDPEEAVVLTDYRTHQAFYDFETVYVWERLPWYIEPGQGRFYPENREILRRLIKEEVQYIVVGDKWLNEIENELFAMGLLEDLEIIDRNEEFSVMRINRRDG